MHEKAVKLINHYCLPTLMLLNVMLYLMLLAALSNAVYFCNAFFLLILANAFCFHALSWFIET